MPVYVQSRVLACVPRTCGSACARAPHAVSAALTFFSTSPYASSNSLASPSAAPPPFTGLGRMSMQLVGRFDSAAAPSSCAGGANRRGGGEKMTRCHGRWRGRACAYSPRRHLRCVIEGALAPMQLFNTRVCAPHWPGRPPHLLGGHVDVGHLVVLAHHGDVGDDIDGRDVAREDAHTGGGGGGGGGGGAGR